jgi:NAD(P)-dependent dehydrogenase (short-subunit alcohol dehydrogenase family)
MFDFSDRVALVTGAGGNLGNAVAHAFYAAGAKLVLVERSAEKLHKAFPESAGSPDRLLIAAADLSDPESVHTMLDVALARFGQVDIAANTVGGYRAGKPVQETSLETWDFMLSLNARTAFVLSQAVIPHMLGRKYGKIVHVSARAGLEGTAKHSAYSISKSAVIRLTESLGAELRHQGINVNCVLPGTIDTPQNRQEMPNADHSRWVPPEAIADVVLFLASDAARAINGAAIPVYGRS